MEHIEERKTRWYIVMPTSSFFMVWNIIIIILLVYFSTYVPFEIAFLDTPDTKLRTIISYSIDFLFLIDIFINFLTAYELPNKKMEKRLRYIGAHYLTSWFIIDIGATFPIQLVL